MNLFNHIITWFLVMCYYGPQLHCGKIMFSQASVCPWGRGISGRRPFPGHMSLPGGRVSYTPTPEEQLDTVGKRAVLILPECFLGQLLAAYHPEVATFRYFQITSLFFFSIMDVVREWLRRLKRTLCNTLF